MSTEKRAIKFGTGGWRACIGDDFIRENIIRIGEGFCELARSEGKTDKSVIIGYDRRFISDMAAKWLAEVLIANGFHVMFLKRSAPTPLIMHTVKKNNLHYGLQVTASHNPPNYNGIKLIVEEGRDASAETTTALEDIIAELDEENIQVKPFERGIEDGSIEIIKTPFNDYLDDILSMLDIDVIKNRGIRILFDPMHGSGFYSLMVLLYTARCTLDVINSNKDAYFGGHMPAPSEKGLLELSHKVVADGYDLGIAFDCDGDRIGIIDGDGEYIGANQILVMLYYYLHEYKGWRGAVVRNLATTHMLDKVAESFGEECYEVPVGFKYVSAKLDEVNAMIGGESSGGMTVRGHIYGKDSIFTAALFVEMICALDKTPTKIFADLEKMYGHFEMIEDNQQFLPQDKPRIMGLIMEEKKLPSFDDLGVTIKKVGYEDGCKVYFTDDSFVICRFSGTEPLLRIFAEAGDGDTARKYITKFKEFIK